MSRFGDFISERIGWSAYLRPFLYKKLPPDLGWSATLGSLCVLLFVVLAVTGMFLAMYYNPSPDKAYQSIDYIMNDVHMGSILRGIHHWAASAMVIAVFLHMLSNYFSGAFKAPRELTWIIGVCLFLVTLGLGFTGYLLPWDQKAYWATVVSSNIPGDVPVVGEFIKRFLLAGGDVSGLTLTRFYAVHMLILPGLLAFLAAFHIYLVRIHGMAEHPASASFSSGEKPSEGSEKRPYHSYRFFPEHLAKASIVFAIVLALILLLSVFAEVPREQIAGTIDESYLPRPEWYYMWLFQILTYFSGPTEVVGSVAIPLCIILLLFFLPFLSKSTLRAFADRPLATAIGASSIVGIVFLTLMGFAGARPYGEIIMVPDRELTALESQGLCVFVDRECAYCHQILGKGGRREGPDLSNMVAKEKSKETLVTFIRDPKTVRKWTTMPKYDLSEKDLNALASFILSLNFDRYKPKTVYREDLIEKMDGQ
ncbi:MAG: cytochrome b N-terminal domain-containing protein [Deltaproteobacteria bacterium]|jgi:quinol-cytochrome oxidoreductase complex cytochrome b subunit